MSGKTRPPLRKKCLKNVLRSDLSQTDKDCIAAVFEKFETMAEVKHGEWSENGYCSVCYYWTRYSSDFQYCPNCGAKMDGKDGAK